MNNVKINDSKYLGTLLNECINWGILTNDKMNKWMQKWINEKINKGKNHLTTKQNG